MDSLGPSSQVVFHNRGILWSKQTASAVQSIPLQTLPVFYIGETTARDNLLLRIGVIVDEISSRFYQAFVE